MSKQENHYKRQALKVGKERKLCLLYHWCWQSCSETTEDEDVTGFY